MGQEEDKFMRVMWLICVIPLLIGIIVWGSSTSQTRYSTSEYWVAKDYHHVYEKYSGEIVNYISENEKCIIKGDEIIVKTINETMRGWGIAITALFGMFTAGMICGTIEHSKWWQNFSDKWN